ncbi:RDD family protein [Shewanella baltica]|uniref:RDD family protein n=1 Tax=Shewanella baltica TaxID=62322 RepID=UPI002167D7A7|nr:RDD family protein [Shewanella baltica]MCS6114801.1 RDD family protein [Shewanella baltica]MCS6128122.1 RDD family protein [Shewanella baltica]MCS6137487.1 RDD family protein [Shewanella baltica]MCS6146443.1 RDD family protein [Shewanella baltica]MCS6170973.1 RDD family protein [Shewanella baltica]
MKQQQTDLGKDPKTMVTPHAFTIADTVLYTPLAAPLKRALAMLIDGLLITVLAEQMDWMFVLLVVGIIYIEKRSHKLGRFLKWGLYAAMLAFMLLTTADNLLNVNGSSNTDNEQAVEGSALGKQILTSLPAIISLSLCDNYACGKTQVQSLREVIENASASKGMTETERREIVLHTITNSSLSAADSEKLQTEVLDGTLWPVIAPQAELQMPDTQSEPKSTQAIGTSEPTDPAQGLVANTVKVTETTDTTKTVPSPSTRVKSVDDDDESTTHSVIAWVKGFMSDMGLGFGWAAFYFTVFTARFDGQTLGKKMLGIRVIQLDGAKISLWAAFGRYGGYAAGFTTGLLGFMQIFWDANRQGIQDKISSTVVIDLAQMHKKQRLEQQVQGQSELAPALTSDDAASAHLKTSTRSEHL